MRTALLLAFLVIAAVNAAEDYSFSNFNGLNLKNPSTTNSFGSGLNLNSFGSNSNSLGSNSFGSGLNLGSGSNTNFNLGDFSKFSSTLPKTTTPVATTTPTPTTPTQTTPVLPTQAQTTAAQNSVQQMIGNLGNLGNSQAAQNAMQNVEKLQGKAQDFKKEVEDITKQLRDFTQEFNTQVKAQAPNAKEATLQLQQAWKSLNEVTEKSKAFQKDVEEKIKAVPIVPSKDKVENVINQVTRYSLQGSGIADSINSFAPKYQEILDKSISSVGKGFQSLSTISQGFADNIGNSLPPGKARDKIKEVLANVNTNVQKVTKKVGEYATKATDFVNKASGKIQEFSTKAKDILGKVQAAAPKVKETIDKVKGAFGKIKDAFGKAKSEKGGILGAVQGIFKKGSSNGQGSNPMSQIGNILNGAKGGLAGIAGLFGKKSGQQQQQQSQQQLPQIVTPQSNRKCNTGTCCDVATGQFKQSGTACFPSKHPCEQAGGFCDGSSSNCVKQFKTDGTVCPGGTCQKGVCQLNVCEADCCNGSAAKIDGEACSLGLCLKGFCVPTEIYMN